MHHSTEPSLTQQDLILLEDRIRGEIASMLSFSSALLYFPSRPPEGMQSDRHGYVPLAVREERKLLLPLTLSGAFLGILVLKGVREDGEQPAPLSVMHAVRFLLHGLALEKGARRDPLTGLADEHRLLADVSREIGLITSSLHQTPVPGEAEPDESGSRAQFGLILADVDRMRGINSDYGYELGDRILQAVAGELQGVFAQQFTLARVRDDVFAVLCPGWGPARVRREASQLLERLNALVLTVPVTEEKVNPSVSITSCCYPQELPGCGYRIHAWAQARLLLDSCRVAVERIKQLGGGCCFSRSEILQRAGRIVERRTPQTVLVNIGSRLGASEGQVFGVEEPSSPSSAPLAPERSKAEVLLAHVDREESIGEILFLYDPLVDVSVGDRLALLHGGAESGGHCCAPDGAARQEGRPAERGEPDYGAFLRAWPRLRREHDSFALILCQFEQEGDRAPAGALLERLSETPGLASSEHAFCARYGASCLAAFLPESSSGKTLEAAQQAYDRLTEELRQPVSLGIAAYPCLHFGRSETLANARKALEHAKLTDRPHIAVFDSVSLTVSADRCFTQGHLGDAIQEYKTALLMEPGNTTARNSLGICYARSGAQNAAAAEFRSVLATEPGNTIALYNLGSVCWKSGDESIAEECFRRCCELAPEQPYAFLRLARLLENRGDLDGARELYRISAGLPGGELCSQRRLAALDLREGRPDEARSRLHRVLSGNPRDAEALYLLARLYLQQGEDAELAESMAKQCVALRPEVAEYAELLEETLARQDKREEIAALRARLTLPDRSRKAAPAG
jgi:diguanylate cyclase (GGDEF)-like protein